MVSQISIIVVVLILKAYILTSHAIIIKQVTKFKIVVKFHTWIIYCYNFRIYYGNFYKISIVYFSKFTDE